MIVSIPRAGYYHFYRYYPPNTDIMTEEEKKAEIEQMTQLFDTLAREIAIFATDKIEDMSEIKRFYKNLAPEYDHLTSDIIAAIESTESRNSGLFTLSSAQISRRKVYTIKLPGKGITSTKHSGKN